MSFVIIPLKHIILDPSNPIDLTTLSEQDAIRLIKGSYGFLSSSLDVSIRDGIAVIELKEENANRVSEAQKVRICHWCYCGWIQRIRGWAEPLRHGIVGIVFAINVDELSVPFPEFGVPVEE